VQSEGWASDVCYSTHQVSLNKAKKEDATDPKPILFQQAGAASQCTRDPFCVRKRSLGVRLHISPVI
jgi:hypothetical protein